MRSLVTVTGVAIGLAMSQAVFAGHDHGHEGHGDEMAQVKGMVQNILKDNKKFCEVRDDKYFKRFSEGQKPRATVVTCSDSRVQSHALDQTPDNDLFTVRNIGNQIATAEGSVEYGVRHLNTPLLIVIGHSACGAIKAASGDYSSLEDPIKRELDTIKIDKGSENMAGVKANVNNQVAYALSKFDKEVKEGKLVVMGAVYDFRNDLKQGYGKLVVTNLNGETNADALKKSPLLKLK